MPRDARGRRVHRRKSVSAAQTAVTGLLGLKREPPPVDKGRFDPRVLFKAFPALHDSYA